MTMIILFEEYFKERKDFCLKLFKFIFFLFIIVVLLIVIVVVVSIIFFIFESADFLIFLLLFIIIFLVLVVVVVVVRIVIVFLFSCDLTSLIIYIYRGSRGSTEEKQKGKKLERSHYWIGSV